MIFPVPFFIFCKRFSPFLLAKANEPKKWHPSIFLNGIELRLLGEAANSGFAFKQLLLLSSLTC